MSISWGAFALKSLQLALIADQEYAAVAASSTGPTTTLLAPNNFQNLTLELAQVFAPAAPAAPVAAAGAESPAAAPVPAVPAAPLGGAVPASQLP